MYRISTIASLALVAFILTLAPFAQSQDVKTQARALLSKAFEDVNIKAPNSPSFILMTKVRLEEEKKSVDGVYALSWEAPGHFRREIAFPGFTETDVARNDNFYRKRTTEGLPVMIWQLFRLMESLELPALDANEKVKRLQQSKIKDEDATCIMMDRGEIKSDVCVNSATGLPVSVDINVGEPERFQQHYGYAEYQLFEGKSFPRKLTFRGWNSRTIQVTVEKLIQVHSFAGDEFTPPEGARTTSYCAKPDSPIEMRFAYSSNQASFLSSLEAYLYFDISPRGTVRYAQILYISDPSARNEIKSSFLGGHFPIMTCGGRPMGYETVVPLGSM